MNTKTKIGLGLTIIAVFLLIISFSMPWYTYETDNFQEHEGDIIQKDEEINRVFINQGRQSSNYDNVEPNNRTTTVDNTVLMSRIGLMSAIFSVFFVGIAAYSDENKFSKLGAVLIVVGIIFSIIAPLYLMTSLPDALKKDRYSEDEDLPDHDLPAKSFFGSYENTTEEYDGYYGTIEKHTDEEWGGGFGWYISIISGVLLAVALILVILGGKKPKHYESSESDEQYPRYQPERRQQPQQNYDRSNQRQQSPQYDQKRQQPQQQNYEKSNQRKQQKSDQPSG